MGIGTIFANAPGNRLAAATENLTFASHDHVVGPLAGLRTRWVSRVQPYSIAFVFGICPA
jgi:hypothetical protein